MRSVRIEPLEEWGSEVDHVYEGKFRIIEENGQRTQRVVGISTIWNIAMTDDGNGIYDGPTTYEIPESVMNEVRQFDYFIRRTGQVNSYDGTHRSSIETTP